MLYKNIISKEEALIKIKHFCSYQERCHKEVKDKLYSFKMRKTEVEEIVSNLIENNYLCEERFAIQYAGGKHRIKSWGKIKIKFSLHQKGVSDPIIKLALNAIDEEQYLATLKKLAQVKLNTIKSENDWECQSKIRNYLLHKGYESSLVDLVIKESFNQHK